MKNPLLQFDLTNEVYKSDEVIVVKDDEIEVVMTVKDFYLIMKEYLQLAKKETYE